MSVIVQNQDTRREFIDTLIELAEKDDKVLLIVPDVGFNYAEKFAQRFPDRYINTGVTEEATVIFAAALALDGFRPFVYSMINFVAFRPFEMVRNAVALHKAPVVLLGVKGSEKYKFLGFSHNMVIENEDVYHLSPYMPCHLPKTDMEVRKAVLASYESNKANYIRL